MLGCMENGSQRFLVFNRIPKSNQRSKLSTVKRSNRTPTYISPDDEALWKLVIKQGLTELLWSSCNDENHRISSSGEQFCASASNDNEREKQKPFSKAPLTKFRELKRNVPWAWWRICRQPVTTIFNVNSCRSTCVPTYADAPLKCIIAWYLKLCNFHQRISLLKLCYRRVCFCLHCCVCVASDMIWFI